MSELSSRTFTVHNAFLSLSIAAASFPVYDGPQVKLPTDRRFLLVGCSNPLATGMNIAISGSSDWGALGARQRVEKFALHNSYVAWTGTTNNAEVRTQATADIALIEAAMRGDVDLGGAIGNGGFAGLSISEISTIQAPEGAAMHVLFDIVCETRI